jgi:Flp pilus assembly protein TadD
VAVTAACILLATFGAVLVGRSAMADRYRGEADDAVASDPHRALDKIGKSLSLNDEKLASYYTQSAAFARLGRYQAARGSLREATRREPHDFVTWGLLGDLAVRRGDLRLARHDYGQAARLNPRDSSLRQLAAHPRLALGGG